MKLTNKNDYTVFFLRPIFFNNNFEKQELCRCVVPAHNSVTPQNLINFAIYCMQSLFYVKGRQ